MYYFIVNKQGGSGRAAKQWKAVRRVLIERNISFKAYETKYPGHAKELARKISSLSEPDIRLVIAGGDGTVNEVLNGIVDFEKVKVGVVPIGSANDFASGLGLPETAEDALLTILSGKKERRIDAGRVTADHDVNRLFGISAGIGLDAIVCKKVQVSKMKKVMNKLHLGRLSYVLMTVTNLFTMKKYQVRVTTEYGDTCYNDMIFLAAMNLPAEGGGVPMCPDALCDDGMVSVCTADGISKPKAFLRLVSLIKGKHGGKKGFSLFSACSLVISAEAPMVLHADGEYLGDVCSARIEMLPSVLRLMQ